MTIIRALVNALRKKRLVIGVAAVVLAGGISFAIFRPGISGASSAGKQPQAIPTSMAQIRQDMRTNRALAEEGLRLLQERQQVKALQSVSPSTMQRFLKQGAARLKAARAAVSQAPPLKSGIAQGTLGGPFHGCQFKLQSEYISPPSGASKIQMIVYTGASVNEATCNVTAGAVDEFRYTATNALAMQSVGEFSAPTTSPLKITSAHGGTLYLTSLSGESFTFNLTTHKYSR